MCFYHHYVTDASTPGTSQSVPVPLTVHGVAHDALDAAAHSAPRCKTSSCTQDRESLSVLCDSPATYQDSVFLLSCENWVVCESERRESRASV